MSNLKRVAGDKFPIPDKQGYYWQSVYHYCRLCDDKYAKVFDRGDGTPLILGGNVELVESQQLV